MRLSTRSYFVWVNSKTINHRYSLSRVHTIIKWLFSISHNAVGFLISVCDLFVVWYFRHFHFDLRTCISSASHTPIWCVLVTRSFYVFRTKYSQLSIIWSIVSAQFRTLSTDYPLHRHVFNCGRKISAAFTIQSSDSLKMWLDQVSRKKTEKRWANIVIFIRQTEVPDAVSELKIKYSRWSLRGGEKYLQVSNPTTDGTCILISNNNFPKAVQVKPEQQW